MVFSIETNGLRDCSVLNFNALILDNNNNIIEVIDRYYERIKDEKIDYGAIAVNGLEDEIIEAKRKNVTYPKHFEDDLFIDKLFKKVDTIIIFSYRFILSFVTIMGERKIISVMNKIQYSTQYMYNVPTVFEGTRFEEPKCPTFKEAANFARINIEEIKKEYGGKNIYKCYCLLEIYKKLEL